MTKRMVTGLAALVLAWVGVIAAPVARADTAPGGVHDMRGHFAVFTRGVSDPDQRGSLDITGQIGPVLTGRANLTGRAVPVAGTITPEGDVSLSGPHGLGVLSIQAHIPDLAPGDFIPCILEGRFQVFSLGGVRAGGDLVAVHQAPVAGAPSIGGNFSGVMIQDVGDRPVRASLTQTETGALAGRMTAVLFNPQPDPPGFTLTLAGQAAIGGPDTRPHYLLVGGGDGVLATAVIAPDGTASLRGPIRLWPAGGPVQQATVHLDRVPR